MEDNNDPYNFQSATENELSPHSHTKYHHLLSATLISWIKRGLGLAVSNK